MNCRLLDMCETIGWDPVEELWVSTEEIVYSPLNKVIETILNNRQIIDPTDFIEMEDGTRILASLIFSI